MAQRGTYKIGAPYKIDGVTYTPQEEFNHVETGVASWYGPGFHGKSTANGEAYDQSERTAAHRTLQMPSIVRVTNLDNGHQHGRAHQRPRPVCPQPRHRPVAHRRRRSSTSCATARRMCASSSSRPRAWP